MIADLTDDGARILLSPVAYSHKDLIRGIPGSSWSSGNSWTLPLSWSSCIALRTTFGDRFSIGSELLKWATDYRANVRDPALALRDSIDAPGDPALYPHQRADVAFLSLVHRGLLTSSMGVGKTNSAISTLKELHAVGTEVFPALVVCPKSTKTNWAREFYRWWPGTEVKVVKGTATQRRKILAEPTDVYVMNYESMRLHSRLAPYGSISMTRCPEHGGVDESITAAKCHVHPKELNAIEFKSVIGDEIHRAKNPSSMQSRALMSAAGDARIRLGLTGTPIAKNVIDLWSLLHFIDPWEWPTKTKWIDRFVDMLINPFGEVVVSGVKPAMRPEFDEALLYRMRRMTKEVVLPSLPPVVTERRDVEMTPKQLKAYNQMTEEMMSVLSTGTLVTTSSLTQTMRLLQLASSYGTLEVDDAGNEKFVLTNPSSKIDAFLEDLPDFDGRKLIVFAVSRQLIMLLSAALTKRNISHGLIVGGQTEFARQEHIDAFQEGRTSLILATVGAGGTGITLTAADTAVYLQRSWSAIEMDQAAGRYHRIGSEKHKSILRIDYVTPCPVEEAVLAVLDGKAASLQDIVRDAELIRKMLTGELV